MTPLLRWLALLPLLTACALAQPVLAQQSDPPPAALELEHEGDDPELAPPSDAELSALEAQAQQLVSAAPELPPATDTAETLAAILAREEFQHEQAARGESIMERLLAWLQRLSGNIGLPFGAGWAAFGTVMLAVLLVLLTWLLVRALWGSATARQPVSRAQSAEQPQTPAGWLKLAADAARSGDYRSAIRYRFKAVVSRLDLPTAAMQTNWQLQRAVGRAHPVAATSFPGLVGIYEDAWYGGLEADAAHYSRADELAAGIERALAADGEKQEQPG